MRETVAHMSVYLLIGSHVIWIYVQYITSRYISCMYWHDLVRIESIDTADCGDEALRVWGVSQDCYEVMGTVVERCECAACCSSVRLQMGGSVKFLWCVFYYIHVRARTHTLNRVPVGAGVALWGHSRERRRGCLKGLCSSAGRQGHGRAARFRGRSETPRGR